MNAEDLKRRLCGVLAFTPTPFAPDDRLDADGLARHVDFLVRSGVHAVVVCGGVGEFFSLSLGEYRATIQTAVRAARGRVPVVAGIGYRTQTACQLAQYAESVGADGLMINPFYFLEPSEEGTVRHYQAIARTTRLGMIVYSTKGGAATPALMERLAEIDTVVALKDVRRPSPSQSGRRAHRAAGTSCTRWSRTKSGLWPRCASAAGAMRSRSSKKR